MNPTAQQRHRRIAALAGVAAVHALLLALLLLPVTRTLVTETGAMIMVALPAPEPEPPAEPEPMGAEAPPAELAIPASVMAPEPLIVIAQPEKPAPAPVAADGQDRLAGATAKPGAGSGSKGTGTGTGSGGAGTGTGGGALVRARWRSGAIERSDYPPRANRAGQGGSVIVHFDVRPDGSVHRCRVRQSSGHPDIDATTCRLIEERFRYTPARNARGEPTSDVAGWRQDWWLEPRR